MREIRCAVLLRACVWFSSGEWRAVICRVQVFSKHYDPDTGMAFYMDKRSGVTTWVKVRRGD
jgi:hypothetical protein